MSQLSFDLTQLRAAYHAGTAAPTTIVAEVLRRIDAASDDGVWISRRTSDTIIADASAFERRRSAIEQLPLFGIPLPLRTAST